MLIWWILGAGAWTAAIWILASFIGIRVLGNRSRSSKGQTPDEASKTPGAGSGPFVSYPTDWLFAVVDAPLEAREALAELGSSGFEPEDIGSFTGEAGALRIDASGSGHGLFARLVRITQAMSMDADQSQRYEDEAREGRTVIAVHAADGADRDRAYGILKSRKAHYINYYNRFHFETLDP